MSLCPSRSAYKACRMRLGLFSFTCFTRRSFPRRPTVRFLLPLGCGVFVMALHACSKGPSCSPATYFDKYSLQVTQTTQDKATVRLIQLGEVERQGMSDCSKMEISQPINDAQLQVNVCYFGLPASGSLGCTFLSNTAKDINTGAEITFDTAADKAVHVSAQTKNSKYGGAKAYLESTSFDWACGQALDSDELKSNVEVRDALCREKGGF